MRVHVFKGPLGVLGSAGPKLLAMRHRPTLLALVLTLCARAAAPAGECDVCVGVLEEIDAIARELAAAASRRRPAEADFSAALSTYCSFERDQSGSGASALRLDTTEQRMCYVLLPLRELTARMGALGKSVARKCAELGRENPETCALRCSAAGAEDSVRLATPMTAADVVVDGPSRAMGGARGASPAGAGGAKGPPRPPRGVIYE